jgi:hypothetical protein
MPPAPVIAAGSLEAEVLEASAEADRHATAMLAALARRRTAIARLAGVTQLGGKGAIHGLLTVHNVQAALAEHGDVARLLGLPYVLSGHRRGYLHQARAALSASAAFRTTPANSAPTPAVSGELEAT